MVKIKNLKTMENQKMLNLFNRLSWLALIALVAYFLWSNKGCKEQNTQTERDKPENVKQRLTQTGPFLFWHGDTLDVHSVGADFMQYFEPKKHSYTREEALKTTFYSSTRDNEVKISFKLHPIKPQPSNYEMPEKMLILGGDASNFKGFETALIGNGVIDKAFNWTFGKGHLVITSCPMYSLENEFMYWLMYKLEQEAEIAGGKVHIVLGRDPFRKMTKSERAPSEYRPDFFKLQDWDNDTLFHKSSEIGRWIYSKNVVENIGGYLILESGLNEELIDGLPLDTINKIFIEAFSSVKQGDYGSFYIEDNVQKRLLKPKAYRENYRYSDILFGNIAYMKKNSDKHYNTNDSDKRVDRLMNLYKTKHIVGRFPDIRGHLTTANNNKFIGDIPDLSKHGGNSSTNDIRYKGVLIEKNQAFVVDDEGKKTLLFKE
jgi:hypothetical protein